jgi:hypothetical protein
MAGACFVRNRSLKGLMRLPSEKEIIRKDELITGIRELDLEKKERETERAKFVQIGFEIHIYEDPFGFPKE